MITNRFALLADRALFHHLGDHFRPETATVDLGHLMILAIVILLFFMAIWFLQRFEGIGLEKPICDEKGIFAELCKIHELNEMQVALITEVAKKRCGDKWSRLFVDPSLLQAHATDENGETARELSDLGSRFFGFYLFKQSGQLGMFPN
jgi:hypothetical protein